jgi:DUF971 family protein
VKEIPEQITADKNQKTMTIRWKDGHVSTYSFMLLRAACPCASCKGGHDKMRSEPDPDVFDLSLPESSATRLNRVEAVGQYAITIEWMDGHHYGIYNWHFLRALCPCAECRKPKE